MAKMFYTMDETKASLGKNEEEIKQFAREGRLREFRDGATLMFKVDQVEHLKSELGSGGGDEIDLDHAESGAPIGLIDSRGASGSVMSLADSESGGSIAPKDDTSLSADLGMTGSLGGIPSPGKTGSGIVSLGGTDAGSGLTGLGGSMSGKGGTATGITVFGAEDADRADPSAQTAISSSMQDQVNLEGVGSGSGLLDLTREADDTSLGAELLDEIPQGKGRRSTPGVGDTRGASLSGMTDAGGGRVISQPIYMEAADPLAPAFGGMAFGAALVLLFGAFVVTCAILGYSPAITKDLADRGLLLLAAFGLAPVVVGFIVGLIAGKAGAK
jgi:hypothetical protein